MGIVCQTLSRRQLPQCVPYARLFHAEFDLPGEFKPSVWLRNWQTFYDRYDGVVFGLWKDSRLIGGMGAIIIPDLSDGRKIGQEMFIFIDPQERVGAGFLKVIRAFHTWGKAHKLETRLVHLHHKNETDGQREQAARLQRFYVKQGYRKLETGYVREWSTACSDQG